MQAVMQAATSDRKQAGRHIRIIRRTVQLQMLPVLRLTLKTIKKKNDEAVHLFQVSVTEFLHVFKCIQFVSFKKR